MTDPITMVILTTIFITAIQTGWRLYRDSKFVTVFAKPDELGTKLEIIRRYKGFSDEHGLENEEIRIKATYVNPYQETRELSYLIYVPKIVLVNARYEDSKKRFEDIFNLEEQDGDAEA